MNFVETHNIRSYEQLAELTANTVITNGGMLASIKADETKFAEIKVMMTHLQNIVLSDIAENTMKRTEMCLLLGR